MRGDIPLYMKSMQTVDIFFRKSGEEPEKRISFRGPCLLNVYLYLCRTLKSFKLKTDANLCLDVTFPWRHTRLGVTLFLSWRHTFLSWHHISCLDDLSVSTHAHFTAVLHASRDTGHAHSLSIRLTFRFVLTGATLTHPVQTDPWEKRIKRQAKCFPLPPYLLTLSLNGKDRRKEMEAL